MKKFIITAFVLLAGCSAQEINKNAENEQSASLIPLTRVFQRVVRYNCAGAVTSDQIETTQSPIHRISIHPKTRENIYSAEFENLNLNTKPGCIVDDAEFNLDYSYGFCNMRVETGANQIRYRFYYCSEWTTKYDDQGKNPIQVCTSTPELREEGTTWVKVSYEEINDPTTVEVRPTPEDCQQQKPK